MKDQGFKKLKGKTIADVKVDGVNSIRLICDDGTTYVLDTDAGIGGIPVLKVTKQKAVPARKKEPVKMSELAAWPFPTGKQEAYKGPDSLEPKLRPKTPK